MPGDLYETLQVSPRADPEVIEATYRRLSRKYHPDINPAPDADLRMRELNAAYEVLRDPVKRSEYDRELRASPFAQRPPRARTPAPQSTPTPQSPPPPRTPPAQPPPPDASTANGAVPSGWDTAWSIMDKGVQAIQMFWLVVCFAMLVGLVVLIGVALTRGPF